MHDATDLKTLSKQLIHSYYCDQNGEEVLEHIDNKNSSWIGIGNKAEIFGYGSIRRFLQKSFEPGIKIQIINEEYMELMRSNNYAVIYASIGCGIETLDCSFISVRRRITFIYRYVDDRWKITHLHASVPGMMLNSEGYSSNLEKAVNQAEIERERYEIVSELTDDIIFEYDMGEDRLTVFYPTKVDGKKTKRVVEQAYFGSGAKKLGVHEEDYDNFCREVKKVMEQKKSQEAVRAEYRIRNTAGSYIWRRVLMKSVTDVEGTLVKIVGKVIDISVERELVKQSVTDTLTGAYNRSYIEKAVKQYLLSKSKDVLVCCMLLDIDYFKEINDKQGHLTGDCVLIELVQIIKKLFRATDIVARIGGDEFMILMKDVYSIDIVTEKAEKLLCYVNKYGEQKDFSERLSLSIGVVVGSGMDITYEELYHKVDIALYNAKDRGRDRYILYEDGMTYPM